MAQQGDPFPFFHLFSSDYSLDDLSALTSAQLAAAWVLHPDYDEATHSRKIAKIWRSRREKGRHLIGSADLGVFATPEQRAEDPCFGFELIDLGSWDMPADLSSLTSAQLAALPFHPQFQADKHAEQAEDIFYKRRDRGGGVSMLDAISGKVSVPVDMPAPAQTSQTAASNLGSLAVTSDNAQSADATASDAPGRAQAELDSAQTANVAQDSHRPGPDKAGTEGQDATSVGQAEPAKENLPAQSTSSTREAVSAGQAGASHDDSNPSSNLIPEGLVETWAILHLNGISREMPSEVVWSLLSPPHLPPPIAVKLRPARPAPGYAESNFYLCFAAYKNDEDADLAQRGLNGATFGKNTVKAERSVSKRRAAVWEWSMLSDEARQALATVDLSQYAPLTVSARPQSTSQRQQGQQAQRASNPSQRQREPSDSVAGNGPPNKRKRRDQSMPHHSQQGPGPSGGDTLPSTLVERLACVQIYNLPLNITLGEVYHYFPPVLAGAAVTTDPKDVAVRKPAPGRIFLAFEDPEVRREVLASHVTKKQFPGCDRTMWYRTDDPKEGGWQWHEMTETFRYRHAQAREVGRFPPGTVGGPSGLPPPGPYAPRYDWPPSHDGWARPPTFDYSPKYPTPMRGGMAPGPRYYPQDEYGRPPRDYGRYDEYGPPVPGVEGRYALPPHHGHGVSAYRDSDGPHDTYGRSGMPPPHFPQYGGPPPPHYGGPAPPMSSGRRNGSASQAPPPYDYRSSPHAYGHPRYDTMAPSGDMSPARATAHGAGDFPPINAGSHTLTPGSSSSADQYRPFEGNNGNSRAAPPQQADLDSLLATLKRPESGTPNGKKREWEGAEGQ